MEDINKAIEINALLYNFRHMKNFNKNIMLTENETINDIVSFSNAIISGDLQSGNTKLSKLNNIFNIFKEKENTNKTCWALEQLQEKKSILDLIENIESKSINENNYFEKIESFLSHYLEICKKNQNENLSTNANYLLKLLELNFSLYPISNTKNNCNDSSLFNNCKLTAMIASCLYNYFEDSKKNYDKNMNYENNEMFLLVSGDISGIQNFIYTTSNKGALKMLRGRSFLLEMLCEHIIDELLDMCNISRSNILYSGGGHFYGVFPNTEKIRNIINSSREILNDKLFSLFSNSLSISISYEAMTPKHISNSDFTSNSIGQAFRECTKMNSKQKLSKYNKKQMKSIFIDNFNNQKTSKAKIERECCVCSSSADLKPFDFQMGEDDISVDICPVCKGCFELGKVIPNINKFYLSIDNMKHNSLFELPTIKNETKYLHILDKNNNKNIPVSNHLYSINSYDINEFRAKNIWVGNYAMNTVELKESSIDFEELAKNSKGITRIGVLRMDVDNLGTSFSKGFESNDKNHKYKYISLDRSASLSHYLSLFFKNEINKLCEDKSTNSEFFKLDFSKKLAKQRAIAIVYAGGDDVFVVGAWNEVLEFAVDLNNAFKKFTNEKLTLSAGFGLFNSKFPISQMAQIVGELEHSAKKHEYLSKEKNAISLFGSEIITDFNLIGELETSRKFSNVYTWEIFENEVCKEKLKFLIDTLNLEDSDTPSSNDKFSIGNSMIYKIMALLREVDEYNSLNISRIIYTIARLEPINNAKKLEHFNIFKCKIYEWITNTEDRKQFLTAIYLYVYLNRKGE